MKRILAAAMALLLMFTTTVCAFAEDSPLAASDRLTSQLVDIQKRREEIEKTVAQREAAKKAAIYSGRNMSASDDFSYFLNRKIMTKNDFEAFKWSFIFSQFAFPLEDSLLDVTTQDVFDAMVNDNFTITGVKEFLITDSTDTVASTHTDEYAMLQDTNVTELIQTMKDNYAVYPIYDNKGNQPTLKDILVPQGMTIFETFYLYDTLADSYVKSGFTNIGKDASNSIFYNQDLLQDLTLPNIQEVHIPVFVYDAATYLYLQIAVGSYLKCEVDGCKTTGDLNAKRGNEVLCIDSYGNICSRTVDGRATILLPNFGNPILNARDDTSGSMVESINLYNKWVSTLYSRSTRAINKVYHDIPVIEYLDALDSERDESTGSQKLVGTGNARSHYATYLRVNTDKNNLSGTLLLVEPCAASAEVTEFFLEVMRTSKQGYHKENSVTWNAGDRVRFAGYLDADLQSLESAQAIDFLEIPLPNYSNVMSNLINSIFNTIKHHPFGTLVVGTTSDSNHNVCGITRSPYNYSIQRYAPFVATSSEQHFYINEYPLLNWNVDICQQNIKNTDKDSAIVTTHAGRVCRTLSQASWSFAHTTYKSGIKSGSENTAECAIGSDDLLIFITRFEPNQILDNRFACFYASQVDGTRESEIFIPKAIVDVGQTMEAYIGDEKGMFLAEYKIYYTDFFSEFCENIITLANGKLLENLSVIKSKTNSISEDDSASSNDNSSNSRSHDDVSIAHYTKVGDTIYAKIDMWNDAICSRTAIQEDIFCTIQVMLNDTTLSQENLAELYSLQNQFEITDENYKIITESTVYKTTSYNADGTTKGEPSFTAKDESTSSRDDKGMPQEYAISMPFSRIYYYKSNDNVYFPSFNNDFNNVEPTSANIVDYLNTQSLDSVTTGTVTGRLSKFKDILDSLESGKNTEFKFADIANQLENNRYVAISIDYVTLLCGIVDKWALGNHGLDFNQLFETLKAPLGIDAAQVLNAYTVLFTSMGLDAETNGLVNDYFSDEYVYTLRNPTYLSEELGCNTTSDFATITYFWDRHYLQQSSFNNEVIDEAELNWNGDGNQASMHTIYEAYLKEIENNHFSASELSLQDFVEANQSTYKSKNVTEPVYTPYYYEWGLQDRNKSPDGSVQDHINQLTSSEQIQDTQGTQQTTEDKAQSENATQPSVEIQTETTSDNIFGSTNELYNYLDGDTIILYPFSRLATSDGTYLVEGVKPVKVYAGLGDAVLRYSADGVAKTGNNGVANPDYAYTINTDLVSTIMALQCNTDYKHNSLTVAPTAAAETKTVTKEELMNNANEFFTNPVSSISYIFTGFLYQVHATIATGSLGSVFSISWLVESDAYKWVMNRYIAIIAIAVGIILLLKLIQFAMNKSKDIASIGRSVVGILAMCLVPVVIFNSFVWAFNASSAWFLHGSLDKILLSQIDVKERERINNDAGVTAELNAFKEQFEALNVNGYECITFEEMSGYSLENGPSYTTKGIWKYMDDVTYSVANGIEWYTDKFKTIHSDRYDESIFYFFYDYIRAEYFNYCCNIGAGANTSSVQQVMRELTELYKKEPNSTVYKDINVQEQVFAMFTGGFRAMLEDTRYVYGDTLLDENKYVTGGPQARDLVGAYIIFNRDFSEYKSLNLENIYNSAYYKAWLDSDLMSATNDIVPKTWIDQKYLAEYFADSKLYRGKVSYNSDDAYYIITSYQDLFNNTYNFASLMETSERTKEKLAVTPLEEKLCAVTDDIYNTTLKALNYLPSQIHDESAITLMAMIATCKFNEAFGVAPAEPIMESVTLDSFVRTAFLTRLEDVGSNVNTLYAMITQGDSIGKVLVVVFLELIICVASVARVLIILYITIAAFVILGLRLLHKAPSTTDLVYGIVGNMLALLALHAITLFLVVIAVEAVAGAVSVVPSLLLDILMIAFTIMMAIMLVKLVKNIAKDAINIGGAKIKGMVHAVGDTVMRAVKSITHNDESDTETREVNINTNTTNTEMTSEEQAEERVERRRPRVTAIVENIQQVEAEEAEAQAQEQANRDRQANQVERNLNAEREITDNEG